MTTDYDWPALPGGDVLMQLREAQAALSRMRALAEQSAAIYPADCACPHGMGFQFHRFPCPHAGDVTKAAIRAALGGAS